MGFLTGGSKNSSTSQNVAYPYLQNALGSTVSTGTGANNALANALGVGSDPNGAAQGLQNFFNSAGGQFTMQQGQQAIDNNAATHGLLNSGATLKALQGFGQSTAQQYYGNYLSDLNNVASNGLNAAGIIGGAGQQTQSTGSSSPGLLGALGNLGQGLGAIGVKVSDRRLKRDIEKLDEMPDGLGIYAYRYVGEQDEQIGVMADEVERLRPCSQPQIEAIQSRHTSDVAALKQLGSSAAYIQAQEGAARSNADLVLQKSAAVPRSSWPTVNELRNGINRHSGDANTITAAMKRAPEFNNHSGTAHAINGVQLAEEALDGHPVKAAGIGLAQYSVGKLLASPVFARWVAAAPTKAAGAPALAHVNRLTAVAHADPAIANEVLALQQRLASAFTGAQAPIPLAAQDRKQGSAGSRTLPLQPH